MIRSILIEVNIHETLTDRELAILQTLMLTIISASTTTGAGEMKPIPTSDAALSVRYELHNELELVQAEKQAARIKKLLLNSFRMSGLAEPVVVINCK